MTPDLKEHEQDPVVRYGRWIVRYRWPVVILSILLCVAAGSGGRLIGFDTSYRVFFGKENPQMMAFDRLENVYNKNDNVMLAIEPKDGNVFSPEFLQLVAEVTEEGWQLPYARRVDSITNFQHSWSEEDDLIVEDLIDPSIEDPRYLEDRKQVALREPAIHNRLLSSDATITAVNITVELQGEDPKEVEKLSAKARELKQKVLDENPDVNVYLTGVVLLNNAFSEGGQGDMKTLTPIMFGIMIVAMIFLLRSVLATVATLFVIVFSVMVAMGLTGLLGIKLTPPSSIAPTMIMTLAVADSIHVLISMLAAMLSGLSRRDAIVESLRVNVSPIVITSVTTAIGFASLNFSDAPPFRDLGNIAAMGVLAALVLSLTFLPALVSILPIKQPRMARAGTWNLDRLANWVIDHRRPLLWGGVAVVLALAALIPLNDPNDVFVEYFDESVAFRSDSDYVMENLTGLYQVDYSLSAESDGAISEPAYLETMDRFEVWFRQQPGVLQVNSLSHVMKKLNMNMHADDPDMFRTPNNRELAAQYLLLYEMSLPYGLDLNNQINVGKSSTRFSAVLDNMSSKELRAIAQNGEAWLQENAPDGMFSHGIGPAIMFSYISERNIRSMVGGTLVALVLISVCMVFALRSVRYGLWSLVPNLVPAVMSFGLWGLLVGRIDIGLSTVVAISLGIVVDDSVHFLSKYLRARREGGLDAENAVRYAFSTVGKALVVTSLILMAGFLVMTQSNFSMNSNMGWFTLIAVAFALIADFLLLPALLMRIDGSPNPRREAASLDAALAESTA